MAQTTLSNPQVFPPSQKVKVFALPIPSLQVGGLLKNNTPQMLNVQGTLVTGTSTLTITEGAARAFPGAILVGTSIPSETTLVERLTDTTWKMSGNAEATVATAETIVLYPPKVKITAYNPENWKKAPTKLSEPEVNSSGELTIEAMTPAVPYLLAAQVVNEWRYLIARAAPTGSGVTTLSPNKVKVEEASTELIAANANRLGLEIVNTGVVSIYLGLGKAAKAEEGILLVKEGGTWNGLIGAVVWTGSVFGIGIGGKPVATVVEV